MDGNILEDVYRESLDERLISYLSEVRGIPLETAMDVYYRSRLAEKIHQGMEGVQYLDHKTLIEILLRTEPDILKNINHLSDES